MEKDKTSLERTILLATSVLGGLGGCLPRSTVSPTRYGRPSASSPGSTSGSSASPLWCWSPSAGGCFASPPAPLGIVAPGGPPPRARQPGASIRPTRGHRPAGPACAARSLWSSSKAESGAGKSALLQAGLVPALRGHPGLLPIYVESLAGVRLGARSADFPGDRPLVGARRGLPGADGAQDGAGSEVPSVPSLETIRENTRPHAAHPPRSIRRLPAAPSRAVPLAQDLAQAGKAVGA